MEIFQHGDGGGYVAFKVVEREVEVGEVGGMEVFGERAGEVGVGDD